MKLETHRLTIKTLMIRDAVLLQDFWVRNMDFFRPWIPVKEQSYYDLENLIKLIKNERKEFKEGRAVMFYLFLKTDKNKITGRIELGNIIRGPFQSCYLGYLLDKEEQNKGYMTEAILKVVEFAFRELKLHRVEANIMPRNTASRKVVEKLNFEIEGLGKKYLMINGRWEDHLHYVKLNEDLE